MSDELILSRQLILDVVARLKQDDPRCASRLVACQYLAAVIGYLVARQRQDNVTTEDILEELLALARHVAHTNAQHAAASDPSQAFGIWRPGSD